MLIPCRIVAWIPTKDEPNGVFGSRDCLINEAEPERLHEMKKYGFLEIFVDDMKKMWIPVWNINQIVEVKDGI